MSARSSEVSCGRIGPVGDFSMACSNTRECVDFRALDTATGVSIDFQSVLPPPPFASAYRNAATKAQIRQLQDIGGAWG